MAHVLIMGQTESGKTTLAKKLAHHYKQQGIAVIVLDPIADPEWPADFRTSDPDEFLDFYWQARGCAAFIDEAGETVGRFDTAMQKTATRGRHWGHRNHYISQRGTMINRTVRDQCSTVFLFSTALEDCKIHARDWNKPGLIEAAKLAQGEYLACGRFTDLKRGRIF